MPFTFAHPLYAAPLKSVKPKWFSLTGLILGSMSPDFEYFIMLEPYQTIGHTIHGLFVQAIPLSVFFAFVYHFVLKEPLQSHLPFRLNIYQGLMREKNKWKLNTLAKWEVFLTSVAIGFLSHIFIDSFTHSGGYFVLRSEILQSKGMGLPIYKILQHGLSLLGLAVPLFLLVTRREKAVELPRSVSTQQKGRYWSIVLLTSLIVLILKLTFGSSENVIGVLVVAPITGFWLGVVISSMIYRNTMRMN